MKNKNSFLLALILVCIVAVGAYIMLGGLQGPSAYELAVKNGFTGTEVEWLNSLKGGDGEDAGAVDYMSMYTTCKENGEISNNTTFLEFIQSLLENDAEDKQLISIQNSIRNSVGIYNLANSSAGSGTFFRIDDDGTAYIVTNYHVTYSKTMPEYYYILLYEDNYMVNPAKADQKALFISVKGIKATYVGGSLEYDIAVLKINKNEKIKNYKSSGTIAAVKIDEDVASDRSDLHVGQSCYAVGNGMGEGVSAVQGIVSVVSEEINLDSVKDSSQEITMRLIRTTCLINGGNSGGALFNEDGELIGVMNSKREYQSTKNLTEVDGVTYAIPASIVVNVYNKIMDECEGTAITEPTFHLLGIEIQLLESKAEYNTSTGLIDIKETMKISSIVSGGNADLGGLELEDVLISYTVDYLSVQKADITDAVTINHMHTLPDILLSLSSGDKITIKCLSSGELVDKTITIQ